VASPIINIKFLADLKGFSSQMQNANRSLDKVGKKMQRTGASLTAGLTLPLVGLGAVALKAFGELEGVSAAFDRLNQKDLLADLREATKGTVSDLELMTAAVKAENFQIPLEQMGTLLEFARRRAKDTGESVDYLVNSIVTGIGRKSPMILDNLGISAVALKDELGGVSAASASIAEVTKAVGTIASQELQKMGADTFTLKEGMQQIGASFQNILAEFGGIIAEFIKPFVEGLKNLVQGFQALSPETKKFIVIVGGVAAAIGPLLALAGTILPAIATGFAILTGPIGLLIAALTTVGVIIYKNWAPIKKTLVDIANYFIDLYNESMLFRAGVQSVVFTFKNLFEIGKFVFETLKNIVGGFIDNFVNGFKTIGAIIKAVFTGNLSAIPGIIKNSGKESIKNFKGFTSELANDWQNLTDGIKQNGQEAIEAITTKSKITFIESNVDATPITEAVKKATAKGLVEGVSGGVSRPKDLQSFDTSGMAQTTIVASPLDGLVATLPEQFAQIDEQFLLGLTRMQDFRDGMAEIMSGFAENAAVGFGQFLGAFASGNAGIGDLASLLLNTVADMAIRLGKLAISIGVGVGAIKTALQSLNPAVAIAAGIALVALGTLVKSAAANIAGGDGGNLPAFADGGIVGGSSFYGDKILARVNSGELVLNQKQQRNLVGQLNAGGSSTSTIIPDVRIEGDALRLVFDRATYKNNRRG
jgi:hypothetical protein